MIVSQLFFYYKKDNMFWYIRKDSITNVTLIKGAHQTTINVYTNSSEYAVKFTVVNTNLEDTLIKLGVCEDYS